MELFLDCNAHLPVHPDAIKTFEKLSNSIVGYGNPASISLPGKKSADLLEETRLKFANIIGAKSADQIIFTNGATHAAEWACKMLVKQACKFAGTSIKISPFEHPAIKMALEKYITEYSNIRKNQDKNHAEIHIHSQNESGIIYDVKSINKNSLVDFTQSLGKIPINVTDLNIDIGIFSCHKFGGFNNLGFIYLKDKSWWVEFGTGSRYFTDRPGTHDVIGLASSIVALEKAIETMEERTKRCLLFKNKIENYFKSKNINIIGQDQNRLPGTTLIHIPNEGIYKLLKLQEKNIYVGLGSACGSHATALSSSIAALGFDGQPGDFLRISQFGQYTDCHANYFIEAFDEI